MGLIDARKMLRWALCQIKGKEKGLRLYDLVLGEFGDIIDEVQNEIDLKYGIAILSDRIRLDGKLKEYGTSLALLHAIDASRTDVQPKG